MRHADGMAVRRIQLLAALGLVLIVLGMLGELIDLSFLAVGAGVAGVALMFAAYRTGQRERA